ncbi:MAG: MFS transporter [Flavobacteriales bacterium]|nr:MFS transporter [Flavobacteriales bacterium]
MQVKNETLLLFILAAVQFTNIVDFMIMMPMGDILQRALEITPFKFSALVSAYPVAAFVSSLFGVFFLDKFDRKKALLFAYSGFILGTLSSAVVPNTASPEVNYSLFIGTRLLTGLFGGILGALVMSIVGDVIPLERRGRAMGLVATAFSLAAILGVPLGLALVNAFDGNWHIPFYMVSSLGTVVIPLIIFGVPSIREHLDRQIQKPHPFETIRVAAKSKNQQLALLFVLMLVIGHFSIIPFITPYMINNVGLTQDQIPFIYLIGGACTVISSPLIGRMVDRFGRKRMFTIMASISMVPVLLITNLWPVSLWVVFTITGSFFIAVSGRMIPANTLITAVVRPENRGGFMSLNSSFTSLATGIASMIGGSIVVQAGPGEPLEGYMWVGVIGVGFTMVTVVLARWLKETNTV